LPWFDKLTMTGHPEPVEGAKACPRMGRG